MKKIALFFFILFLYLNCDAQYYLIGQNRPSIKWKQINTENFQIIFPDNLDTLGQRAANTLELVYQYANQSLSVKPKKTSIILQPKGIIPNGFATLAPRRSEFYTIAPQQSEGSEWIAHLCLHEFRHIVQIDMFNKGFGKVLYWILGEQGVGLLLGATTPQWFLEGDATLIETALSNTGRGRMPNFTMEYKAQVLEKDYNYEKASFGSFKHYTTSHYKLGYHMVSYARLKYSTYIWDSTLQKITKFPLKPFPFSTSFKKLTGVGTEGLYESCTHYYDSLWKKEPHNVPITINKRKNGHYKSYLYPTIYRDSLIIYIERSYDNIADLCVLNMNTYVEKRIIRLPNYGEERFSLKGDKIMFTLERIHPRWQYESYSNLYSYSLPDNQLKQITSKQRLFSPALSDDGARTAAIQIDEANRHYLVIVNSETGSIEQKYPAPQFHQWIHPYWSGQEIIFIETFNGYSSIIKFNVSTKLFETIKKPLKNLIYNPIIFKNEIYYSSGKNGVQNIYKIERKEYQLTDSQLGVAYPFPTDSSKLFCSNYTAEGYNISKFKIEEYSEPTESQIPVIADVISDQEGNVNLLDSIPNRFYETKKYRALTSLFNVHSWQPIYLNPETEEVGIGAGILSQNLMSNTVASLLYRYDNLRSRHQLNAQIDYNAFFVQIGWETQLANYKVVSSTTDNVFKVNSISNRLNFDLPLSFTNPRFFHRIDLHTDIGVREQNFVREATEFDSTLTYFPLQMNLNIFGSSYRAKKDIEAPFNYNIFLASGESFNIPASYFFASAKLGVPGLLNHHNIALSARYINSKNDNFLLPAYTVIPTGYLYAHVESGIFSAIYYQMPLLYPDFRIGKVLYIQRIRTKIQQEKAWIDYLEYNQLNATNIDVVFDCNVFRYSYLMSLGLKTNYAYETENISFQFLFDVSF